MTALRAPQPLTLALATEVFARGRAVSSSLAHPYDCTPIEELWWLRDAPRKDRMTRRDEWVVGLRSAAEVDRIARSHSQGNFGISTVNPGNEPDPVLRDRYKALGYRPGFAQPLMVHALRDIPALHSPAVIERVATPDLADRIAEALGQRQLLPEHFRNDAVLRLYAALVDGELAGWVRSVSIRGHSWCTTMHVKESYRRRGVASALLARMLGDDLATGSQGAVLLASHLGSKLYAAIGYCTIGTIAPFAPDRRSFSLPPRIVSAPRRARIDQN